MPATQKETILIVHGTWASPDPATVKWYQPGVDAAAAHGEFVAKLDAELDKRGSPARCWAHCQDHNGVFCWTGQNAWIDRTRAAEELARSVNLLQTDGWRVHVIAHSHGGNVAVAALPELTATKENPTGLSGTMTTLGTPFIDVMSPIAKRLDRRRKFDEYAAWGFYLIFVALFALALLGFHDDGQSAREYFNQNYIWIGLFIGLVVIGLFSLLHSRKRRGWKQYFDGLAAAGGKRPFMLNLSSSMDEAWQLLHHLRTFESPIAPKSGLLGYILESRREYLRKSVEVERIHGAALFSRQSRAAQTAAVLLLAVLPILGGGAWDVASTKRQEVALSWLIDFQREHDKQASAAFIEFVAKRPSTIYEVLVTDPVRGEPLIKAMNDELARLSPEDVSQWEVYKEKRQIASALQELLLFTGGILVFWFGLVSTFTFFLGRTFYSVVWSPLRWVGRQVRALVGVPSYVGSYIVRRNAWSLLQELSMGLEGYRLKLPQVDKTPPFVPPEYCKYEDMPKAAEAKALAKRNEWIGQHFGDVSETFSKLVVTGADATALLRMIENDISLVHAAYYTDDECIARIADWVSGRDRDMRPKARPNA